MRTYGNIEDLLAGKEQEVIDSIRRIGVSATMELYGLKRHNSFLKWLRGITPEGFYPTNFKGMTGGNKSLWLKNNREFIIQCIDIWGKDFIIENLNIGKENLDNLIRFNKTHDLESKRGKQNMDKVILDAITHKQECVDIQVKMLHEQLAENRRHIEELKTLYSKFVESVSDRIASNILTPLIEHLTRPNVELNLKPNNTLSLNDIEDLNKGEVTQTLREIKEKLIK